MSGTSFSSLPIAVPQDTDEFLLVRSNNAYAVTLAGLAGGINFLPQPSTVSGNSSVNLTASSIVGLSYNRTGSPSAAVSDVLPTASSIIGAMTGPQTNTGFFFTVINSLGQNYSLLTNTGITLNGVTTVPVGNNGVFILTVTGASTISIWGVGFYPNSLTSSVINNLTVNQNANVLGSLSASLLFGGNSPPASVTTTTGTTISAAQILSGVILRSGPTANFTDTTDTAANIIGGIGSPLNNTGMYVNFVNLTSYQQTLSGGSGVSISYASEQSAIIQPNNSVIFRMIINPGATDPITFYRVGSFGI